MFADVLFYVYMYMEKVALIDGSHMRWESVVSVIRCRLKEDWGPIVSVNIVSECIKCARGWIRIGGLSSGKLYGFVTKQNIEKR